MARPTIKSLEAELAQSRARTVEALGELEKARREIATLKWAQEGIDANASKDEHAEAAKRLLVPILLPEFVGAAVDWDDLRIQAVHVVRRIASMTEEIGILAGVLGVTVSTGSEGAVDTMLDDVKAAAEKAVKASADAEAAATKAADIREAALYLLGELGYHVPESVRLDALALDDFTTIRALRAQRPKVSS